jgi:hypothetical protein
MGMFANPVEGGGSRSEQTKLPWKGESGWAAMGHQVPEFRKTAAEQTMKMMGWNAFQDAEKRFTVVSRMAGCIERDNTHGALEFAFQEGVDATGAYRLLSVLLTAPAAPGHSNASSEAGLEQQCLQVQ